jgi:hypothetical protein
MMNVHILVLYTHHVIKADQTACLSTFIFCHSSNASSKRLAVFRRRRFPVISHSPSRAAGFPPAQAR